MSREGKALAFVLSNLAGSKINPKIERQPAQEARIDDCAPQQRINARIAFIAADCRAKKLRYRRQINERCAVNQIVRDRLGKPGVHQ